MPRSNRAIRRLLTAASLSLGLSLAGLLAVIAAPAASAQPPEPQLYLTDLIPVDAEGRGAVTWTVGRATTPAEPVDFDDRQSLSTETTDSWSLAVERSVTFDETVYSFFAYLRPRPWRGEPVHRYKVEARAEGSFRDGLAEVPFQVEVPAPDGGAAEVEEGVVRMKVYDPAPVDFLVAEPDTDGTEPVFIVRLGEQNELPIKLSNRLNAEAEVVGKLTYDTDIWESLEVTEIEESKPKKLEPEGEVSLTLRGEPNSLPALLRSILPRAGGHDKVSLDLQPVSLTRRGESATVVVDVRFIPSLTLLVAVLFLGVLLGSLTRLLFSPQPWRRWLRPFFGSLLLSLILWIASVCLHAAESRLQLFGMEINPLDAVGVSLIGILVGFGGERMVGWVEKRLGLHDIAEEGEGGPRPAEPAAAEGGTS